MRSAVLALAVFALAVLLLPLAAGEAAAQGMESFYNKRFCAVGGGGRSSSVADCSYNTWEQCRASASGLGRYCTENPYWQPEADARRGRATSRPR